MALKGALSRIRKNETIFKTLIFLDDSGLIYKQQIESIKKFAFGLFILY